MESAMILHELGVVHNDFRERNIRLDKEGDRAWIVDFGEASSHKCASEDFFIGGEIPDRSKFGCSELYAVAIDTRMWVDYGK